MGNSCKQKKDTEYEDTQQLQIITVENGIQGINTTIKPDSQQLKLSKESPQEGVQISNIQVIMIKPRNEEEGAQILRDLIQFGNKIIVIPKVTEDSPNVSAKSLSKKGILKNKGFQLTKLSLHSCNQQKRDRFLRYENQ
ncbi:unnamed protein product (macronuclear) [Paramecium tetraurelia]|uniref:Uncharacterized protein n=1 Tax=Paramecium tetraurelia TaxID=5888 RepID=A0C118_PARTE|nr:uncharacterized protein GSPATT00033961001 [Paramecium tetraurelia]CAK64485.1 unnamed protein product [Paramecium tetraurelia]|eukprot:XP_001431883.1 hypothetical protein (macronuclear) [Paramecium tetraurelia strain d4-2]